jgi:hypothetical protein
MEREAKKKQEYAERAQIDVKEILNDRQVRSIMAADRDQEHLLQADPSRGELISADHYMEGDDSDLIEADEEDFDEKGDETLADLIKDPFSKQEAKRQMMTPKQYRNVTIGDDGIIKEG